MSVREEDRRNKNCPNRGLGIAAAALGVGVGAALYYIFSKRTESPEEDGATSSSWSAEEHALHDSSYTTVSEHSTSDTSINSTSSEYDPDDFNQSDTESDPGHSITDDNSYDSYQMSDQNSDQQSSDDDIPMSDNSFDEDDMPMSDDSIQSDDETNMEFDVTRSSIDVPSDQRSDQRSGTPMMRQFGELTVRLRNRVENRERSWALEQCSICFDMMQKEQEVVSLACTHRFHQACILPWLEQQQTCPVCRKAS